MERRLSRRELAGASAAAAAGAGLAGVLGDTASASASRASPRGSVDVAVVGAGLAGLSAARQIARTRRSVVVLEARDRVGGRTFDRQIGRGRDVAEMGGEWTGPGQDRVHALARELGIETFKTYGRGYSLYYRAGQLQRYKGAIPPASPAALAELELAIQNLNSMAATVPKDPWKASQAVAWDSQTIATWIEQNANTDDARFLLRLAIEGVYGAEPEGISLLDLLDTIRSVGGDVLTLVGSAQSTRFVGGTQQLSEGLAGKLGDRVVLGAAVSAIERRDGAFRLRSRRGAWEARRVIVAVPPPLIDRIRFRPPLPPGYDQLGQRQPMGTTIKCNAVYARPFWRDQGLNGQVLSDTGPLKVVYDNSPRDGLPGVLVGFFEGSEGSDFYDRPAAERRKAALGSLVLYFGEAARYPRQYLEVVWAAEPFTRGAYGSYNPPGILTSLGHLAAKATGDIHFAASDWADFWIGYMDGAIRSGEKAAREALAAL